PTRRAPRGVAGGPGVLRVRQQASIAQGSGEERTGAMAEGRKGSTGRTSRRARVSAAAADAWRIELHTERMGLHPDRAGQFAYRYERLRVERVGRRCTARELRLQLDYDNDLRLVTKPARMVRQRGRSLTLDEAGALWDRVH